MRGARLQSVVRPLPRRRSMLPKSDIAIDEPKEEDEKEDEERITDEIVAHPTRDDWHEQRQREQTREAVVAAHAALTSALRTFSGLSR